jgi:hypothetical protein
VSKVAAGSSDSPTSSMASRAPAIMSQYLRAAESGQVPNTFGSKMTHFLSTKLFRIRQKVCLYNITRKGYVVGIMDGCHLEDENLESQFITLERV